MVKKSIAREYAKSLFDSVSPPLFEKCIQNCSIFSQILSQNPKIVKVFENPSISKEKKEELLNLIGKNCNFEDVFVSFLKLVVERGRISIWNEIEKEIFNIKDQIDGVVRGTIVSSHHITSKEKEVIESELSSKLGKKVFLKEEVKPEIICGYRVQIGSKVFDSTFETILFDMKNYLLKR